MAAAPIRRTTSAPALCNNGFIKGSRSQELPSSRRMPAYVQPRSTTNIQEELLREYIDSLNPANYKLKQQLRQSSAESKYEILKRVRGKKYRADSSVFIAAYICDLEGLKAMLGGLTPEQKFDLASPIGRNTTALHYVVCYKNDIKTHCSSIEILKYLLDSLSNDQSFNLLKAKSRCDYTVLHYDMTRDTQRFLLDCCTSDQQEKLFSIRNKNGASLADISMPVLYKTVQGLEETNKALADVKKTSDGQVRKLNETNLQLREDKEELRQKLNGTNKAQAYLQKSSNRQVQDMKQQTKELEQTKKALVDLQTTSYVEKGKLQKTILKMQQNMTQQTEDLEKANKAVADVKRTSDVQVEINLQLKKDKEEQTEALENAKRDLAALQTTCDEQGETLQDRIEEVETDAKQKTEAYVQTSEALAVLQETSNIQTQGLEQTKKELEETQKGLEETQKGLEKTQKGLEETQKGLEEANKELADVKKSNNELVVELMRRNMLLERDNNQQTQVIQVMSARQSAMEQMLERLEQEFRRPIVTDETGDQELEELDE